MPVAEVWVHLIGRRKEGTDNIRARTSREKSRVLKGECMHTVMGAFFHKVLPKDTLYLNQHCQQSSVLHGKNTGFGAFNPSAFL